MAQRRSSSGGNGNQRIVRLVVVIVIALIGYWLRSRSSTTPTTPTTPTSPPTRSQPGTTRRAPRPTPGSGSRTGTAAEQMLLGNPDNATDDASNAQRYLMVRPQYALSYNDRLRFPNWVSWRLTASDIGNTSRGNFVPDPDLPSNFARITTSAYSGTGYDRGHNCPSKDRSDSRENNDVAFYMTNITPQMHAMNAGPWENLESYCRRLAQSGNELYIVCGHGFKQNRFQTIGRSDIAVPDFGWKIVVVLPEASGDDRARISAKTRVIAVLMPNVDGIETDSWTRYRTTPAAIERATGLRLFSALPQNVAAALKNKTDNEE